MSSSNHDTARESKCLIIINQHRLDIDQSESVVSRVTQKKLFLAIIAPLNVQRDKALGRFGIHHV